MNNWPFKKKSSSYSWDTAKQNTDPWAFKKPPSLHNWDTAKQCTDPWAFKKVPSSYSWDTIKQNTDPWFFEKQGIKLGYINNPYWQESAEFSDVHNPCGYWHKGNPGYTPYVPPPPPKSNIYSAGHEYYQSLIRDPEICHYAFRQIDDTGGFLVSAIGAPVSYGGKSLHIKEDHTLWGIGYNGDGSLGTGAPDTLTALTQIGSSNDWADVKMSYLGDHSIALKLDGTIWTTGTNDAGQLGHGDTEKRYSFTKVGTDSNWVYIEAGQKCCFAINEDGLMYSWGDGINGQLGHGYLTTYYEPKLIEDLDQWEQVSSNNYSSVGLRNNGQLYSTGSNNCGQLCLDIPAPWGSNILTFTQRTEFDTWKSVKVGYQYTILIKEDNSLWSVGYNNHGQLGLGDTDMHIYVTEVNDGSWLKITAGHSHVLCIDKYNNLYATGRNDCGQLGLGDTDDRHVLTKVEGTNWNLVAGSIHFSFAGKIA